MWPVNVKWVKPPRARQPSLTLTQKSSVSFGSASHVKAVPHKNEKTFLELSGWTFEIEEVSAGVYRVEGRDQDGRLVSHTGIDESDVIRRWRNHAARIVSAITEPR